MTIGDNIHKALTSAESLKSSLESFGHDTEDKQAKDQYYRMAQVIETQVLPTLRARTNTVESQEPQYQVKQQAQQKAQQQAQQQANQPVPGQFQ